MTGPTIQRRTLFCLAAASGAALALPAAVRAQNSWWQRTLEAFNGGEDGGGGLAQSRIRKGLKEALRVATDSVIARVGEPGGYLRDPAIRIPLPGYLDDTRSVLRRVGAGSMLDDLEVRLNRAAEEAAPHGRELFVEAIAEMSVEDARDILEGPDDAATRYFQRTMTPDLRRTFRPVVDRELRRAGAIESLDRIAGRVEGVPFAPALGEEAQDRLVEHGVDGALEGIFHYLASEEAAIRNDPAKRTTDLLREVFG